MMEKLKLIVNSIKKWVEKIAQAFSIGRNENLTKVDGENRYDRETTI